MCSDGWEEKGNFAEGGNLEKLSSWSIEIWSNQAWAVIGSLKGHPPSTVKDTSLCASNW